MRTIIVALVGVMMLCSCSPQSGWIELNSENAERSEYPSKAPPDFKTLDYDQITAFSNGFAIVKNDEEYSKIDENGVVYPFETVYDVLDLSDGIALVRSRCNHKQRT